MLIVTLAGNLGRDAEFKTTQNGKELCSFPVAVTVGYGDSKSTVWLDVSKWGAGAKGLSGILRKGTKVAVSGELSTREHNGKTYLQCRADHVTLQGDAPGGGRGERKQPYGSDEPRGGDGSRGHAGGFADDLDDDIPFISSRGMH
jgi:single-strand DNA-binding protein